MGEVKTYLTAACNAGDATLHVLDASGFVLPFDEKHPGVATIDGENVITYTGKTKQTLTGCSGVLSHPIWVGVVSRYTTIFTITQRGERDRKFYM